MSEIQPYQQVFLEKDVWDMAWKQADIYCKSGFLPKSIKTKEQAFTVMMMGSELNISPMTALTNISVINGKPTLEAKLMLSLVMRKFPNCHYKIWDNTSQVAIVEMGRTEDKARKFSYTITQAKDAGLLGKDNWKNYPADMLLWRAISRACRVMFPDVLTVTGHTQDEVETITVRPVKKEKAEELPQPIVHNESKSSEHKISTESILDKMMPKQEDNKWKQMEKK